MGEGEVFFDGARRPSAEVLGEVGLRALDLERKEGLGFVNGTSAMTGMALVNGREARDAWRLGLRLGVLYAELMEGHREAWHAAFGAVRPHPGQRRAHSVLAELSEDSGRLRRHPPLPPELEMDSGDAIAHERPSPQDVYTIRCLPQLYGAIGDSITFHDTTVARELNAVTDNPLVLPDEEMVLHGGNFFGQHVSSASDALNHAVIQMAVHAERVVARITDRRRNGELPPFLQGRQTGLNSGFMGAQVTASALVAEMRTGASPASIQSIPTNADNQDVVTMGTIAARRVGISLERLYEVLAIEALVLVQGFDLVGGFEGAEFCASSRGLADWVRERSAFLGEDRPLASEIGSIAAELRRGPSIPG
jgi:tyrosine ammonia-lyase